MTDKSKRKLNELEFYISRGWPIFPLGKNKRPCIPSPHKNDGLQGKCHGECGTDGHGFYDATLDFDRIKNWHKLYPNAYWAMRTGSKESGGAGLVVIDIDKHNKNGFLAWEQLREEHSEPIETVTVRTKSSGNHLYFAYPSGVIKSGTDVLGSGIDVKADGGYVCIPASNPYTFELSPEDTDVQALPDWLVAKLGGTSKPKPRKLISYEESDGDLYIDAVNGLGSLSPTRAADYSTCLCVGMALHDGFKGTDVGLELFDNWLKSCPEKYQNGWAEKVWRYLDGRELEKRITINSLWFWAREDSGGKFYRQSERQRKNYPVSIDVEPLDVPRDRVSRDRDYANIAPTKINIQIEQTPVNGILGVSIGVARALLRAGLYHYARAYEILAEQGCLGKVITRTEFFNVLSKYMKPRAIRYAYDDFLGRSKRGGKKIYKTRVEQGRTAFLEFVTKISHS